MKRIRLTSHAQEQAAERGATEAEVKTAIRKRARQPAKHGREMCRYGFPFGGNWQGKRFGSSRSRQLFRRSPKK